MQPANICETGHILLIRVNCIKEILDTKHILDEITATYPKFKLMTIASVGTEGLALLEADRRLDHIVTIFAQSDSRRRRASAITNALAEYRIEKTILVASGTELYDYSNQLIATALSPGGKWIKVGEQPLTALNSISGLVSATKLALISGLTKLIHLVGRAQDKVREGLAKSTANRGTRRGVSRPVLAADYPRPRRLLVLPLDGLGDCVLSLPIIRALADGFPDAGIDVVCRSAYSQIFDNAPISEIVLFETPGVPARTKKNATLIDILKLARRLRSSDYDIVIDLGGRDIHRLLAYMSGAPVRVGPERSHCDNAKRNLSSLLTIPVEIGDRSSRTLDNSKLILNALGIFPECIKFDLDQSRVSDLEPAWKKGIGSPYVVFQAASAVTVKQWSISKFSDLADRIATEFGVPVVLTGSNSDKVYNDLIASKTLGKRIYNIAGSITLGDLPAVMAGAALLVSVDTGPMHVAAAVGTPIISLFRTDDGSLYFPHGQEAGVILPTITDTEMWLNDSTASGCKTPVSQISVDRVYGLVRATLLNQGLMPKPSGSAMELGSPAKA